MKHADIVFDTDLSFGSIEDNSSFELEDPTESRRYTATFGELKTYDESIKKFILKLSKIIPVVPEVLVSEIHFLRSQFSWFQKVLAALKDWFLGLAEEVGQMMKLALK